MLTVVVKSRDKSDDLYNVCNWMKAEEEVEEEQEKKEQEEKEQEEKEQERRSRRKGAGEKEHEGGERRE